MSDDVRLVMAPAVAQMLNTSVPRVWELARQGVLPSVKLGRQVRFDPAALAAFVASGGKALEGEGGWRRADSA